MLTNENSGDARAKRGTLLLTILAVFGVLAVVLSSVKQENSFPSHGGQSLNVEVGAVGDIAHGQNVNDVNLYPFVVRLSIVQPDGIFVCSGSLVDPSHVLTAAHCVAHTRNNGITAIAGTLTRNGQPNTRQERTSVRFVVHANSGTRDVALIVLDRPFDMTSSVNLVALSDVRPVAGTQVTAIGWGVDENDAYPNNLKHATSNIRAGCTHEANEICTQGGNGNTCGGDSGGPLVKISANGIKQVVGVNSWSPLAPGCADLVRNVDVFESVPSYYNWINGILCKTRGIDTLPPQAVGNMAFGYKLLGATGSGSTCHTCSLDKIAGYGMAITTSSLCANYLHGWINPGEGTRCHFDLCVRNSANDATGLGLGSQADCAHDATKQHDFTVKATKSACQSAGGVSSGSADASSMIDCNFYLCTSAKFYPTKVGSCPAGRSKFEGKIETMKRDCDALGGAANGSPTPVEWILCRLDFCNFS